MIDRRKMLTRIVQFFSIFGAFFVGYPFIKSSSIFEKRHLELEVDLSDLSIVKVKRVSWFGRPVIIVNRSEQEIEAINESHEALKDPLSEKSHQPDFARNKKRSIRDDVFVAFANCTHLGCVVKESDDEIGTRFRCPCHNSSFDAAGRVFREALAPKNLEIPKYGFLSKNVLILTAVN